MAEKASIKMLNPRWRPSWYSEGPFTKWRGPEFRAEGWHRKDIHVQSTSWQIFTLSSLSQISVTSNWVGKKLPGNPSSWSSFTAWSHLRVPCWVWVQRPRTTWTSVATNGRLPPSPVLVEAASRLREKSWFCAVPFYLSLLPSFHPVGLGKEPEGSFCL